MRIYDFVKEHVMPFNAVIVMSITVAAVLDFLAPQAAYLAWLSYALAGPVVMMMVLELSTVTLAQMLIHRMPVCLLGFVRRLDRYGVRLVGRWSASWPLSRLCLVTRPKRVRRMAA